MFRWLIAYMRWWFTPRITPEREEQKRKRDLWRSIVQQAAKRDDHGDCTLDP